MWNYLYSANKEIKEVPETAKEMNQRTVSTSVLQHFPWIGYYAMIKYCRSSTTASVSSISIISESRTQAPKLIEIPAFCKKEVSYFLSLFFVCLFGVFYFYFSRLLWQNTNICNGKKAILDWVHLPPSADLRTVLAKIVMAHYYLWFMIWS